MNANKIAQMLEAWTYLFLVGNFLLGLYCVVLVTLRLRKLRFRKEAQQVDFLETILDHLKAGEYSEIEDLCDGDQRALPQLTFAAVSNRRMGYDQLKQYVSELMQRDIFSDIESRVSWIAASIRTGPLWGLFGTVLGMMAAFGEIGSGAKVEAHTIADRIAVALICTAMGLATAIPYGYLLNGINIKTRQLQDGLTSGVMRLLEHFKPVKQKSRGVHV